MALSKMQRLQYLAWAAGAVWNDRSRSCPACDSTHTSLVKRKYLFTSLWRCESCDLRFRVPKDDPSLSSEFYQAAYTQGFTTDCPSDAELAALIATRFVEQKDFTPYVRVLQAAGLRPGDSILDFGCSWGYGSWQLREAGFVVYSYEISKPRARYAREKLSCNVIETIEGLRTSVSCVFSAHVIEHLPDPNQLWALSDTTLRDRGLMICFCPNGDPGLESHFGSSRYHQLWGKVHPMLITPEFLLKSSAKYGYHPLVYGNPYRLDLIADRKSERVSPSDELCLIATKN